MSLGLVAGAGHLPIEVARLLSGPGQTVRAVGFEGLTDARLADVVDEIRWVRLGRLGEMAEAMQALGIRQLLLVGKVPKALLFDGRGIAEPDDEAIRLLSEASDRGDEPLMRSIAGWLEKQGFSICDQGEVLASMLAPQGAISGRAPSEAELEDLVVALPVLRALGRLGVGQCVAVKQASVLAVEAIEGTDAMIHRAGAVGGPGALIVKAARPGQDRRFDLPAVGVGTIHALAAAGATGLAVEAGSTLLVDRQPMIEAADRQAIAVWGFALPADEHAP